MENSAAEKLEEFVVETEEEHQRDKRLWLQVLAAVLMALAAIATSWAAFQEVRWNGRETNLRQEADILESQGAAAYTRAATEALYDSSWFVGFGEQFFAGNEDVAAIYEIDLMRPGFKPFFDAWLALDPLANPAAPQTPFAMEGYDDALLAESEQLAQESEAKIQEADEAQETSDTYVASTVVLASVLFFVGVSAAFESFRVRIGLAAAGAIMLAGVFIFLATLPVH